MRSIIKEKLRSGLICMGGWATLGSTAIVEIFAKSGFDWVAVDLEHSVISIEQAGELIRTIELAGAASLVRVTSNDSNLIKRVMDSGASGIIVPNVNTLEEAKSAVASTRYPPQGSRGVGLGRAQLYGSGFKEYFEWQKDGPVVIAQIENVKALESLDLIFSKSGIDGFIIGPYDLSCSMGIPGDFEHPKFVETLSYILELAKKNRIPAGIHMIEPDPDCLIRLTNEGYQLIAYSVDIRILDVAARLGVSTLARNCL